MKKIKCINRWVVIKPLNPETKTEGGIILPDTAVQRNDRAIVVEIVSEYTDQSGQLIKLDVKKGDEIIYNAPRAVQIIEKDILESYDISEGDELAYILYDDIYFVVEE